VPLPIFDNQNLLDSSQAQIVFEYSQHFPNETELALAFISGHSKKYIGIKRRNDSLIYVENNNKVFEIGSISKTFTATILAKLVHNKKVKIDEPIKNLLPINLNQSSLNGVEITLLDLANHTSGLPPVPDNLSTDYSIPGSPYQYYDENKLYDFLSNRLILSSVPGEKKLYSNLGGGLLGHILTLITKKSYEELILESICKPLGMSSTFLKLKEEHYNYLVRGRDPDGNIVQNWDLGVFAGAGEIKSTASDMVKYVQAFIEDTSSFYHLALQPTFQVNDREIMCLGWGIYKLGEKDLYPVFGGTGGYSCGVIFNRKAKTAIILLTNVSAFLSAKGDYIPSLCRALGK
jgi:CubicO group peptidase (beta-lactamase class C family)